MKKILMLILDGFGMREDIYGNAIKNAGMNNFINIWNNYPHCLLKASDTYVGLEEKQCSDSEFGHKMIGAGRTITNKLKKINYKLKNNDILNNHRFKEMIAYLKKNSNNKLHINILLSDGGVSSHFKHMQMFLDILTKVGIDNEIYLHLVSDGIDSDKKSFYSYYKEIEPLIGGNIYIATICGRCYAMDELSDYKRTKLYYDLLFDGEGIECVNIGRMIELCYNKKMTDAYIPPLKTSGYMPLNTGDVFLSLNYSKKNQYNMLRCMCEDSFDEFKVYKNDIKFYSLCEIDKKLNQNYFYEDEIINNTMIEYLSDLGLSQARIAESIKKDSITYYMNGCKNGKITNCDTYIVDTPNVDSFDRKPEMNSLTVAKTAIKCMEKDYDLIIANFANPDEVGHTGNYQATINGLQAVDVCLGKLIEVAQDNFYKIVIVGSHGKADTIIDRNNNIITKNTTSPVPFIIMDKKIKLNNGLITSVAPTLLKYMEIAIPKEMKESEILIEKIKIKN